MLAHIEIRGTHNYILFMSITKLFVANTGGEPFKDEFTPKALEPWSLQID